MTAIVCIINRNGVAFAADSAATHSLPFDNKKKITNHANKIFELSKYHPIGVGICGNLTFMGLLWEDTIKLYRAKLEKDSYPHISDYVNGFMEFVKESILPKFELEQKNHLSLLCQGLKKEVIGIAFGKLKKQGKRQNGISSAEVFPIVTSKLEDFINVYSQEGMQCGKDFEGYDYDGFLSYAQGIVSKELLDLINDPFCPEGFDDLFLKALYHISISKKHVYLNATELIFWGYGEDDLFPACHSILVSVAFDGRVKWTDNTYFSISSKSPAWIVPFAQTDVSNTVVRGVEQALREKFSEEARVILNDFKKDLVEKLKTVGAPEQLLTAIDGLDTRPYKDLFTSRMDFFIRANYVDKLMDTVSFLMKEDLAEMAESLVKMTCLKRHFTTDDETVGGPVDVAVATKGDGFIWIKRKHYFSADINHHYFER